MSADEGRGSKRLWPRMLAVTIVPMTAQVAILVFIVQWAAGQGSGRGMVALGVLLVMALAIPIALIANIWIVRETRKWHAAWVLLAGTAQAMLIPVCIIGGLLFGIR